MCHGPRSGSSCQSLSFTGSNGLLTSTTSRSSRSSVPSSRDGSPTVPANRSDAARGFSATRSGSDAEALAAIQFDRLYGNTADGVSVGWVDLDTGKRWMERPEFAEAFERAVNLWRFAPAPDRREITAQSWTRTVPLPPACDAFANSSRELPRTEPSEGTVDLADTHAGAGVRTKAIDARKEKLVSTLQATPGRSSRRLMWTGFSAPSSGSRRTAPCARAGIASVSPS
jgi:hypothetical protein